MDRDRRATSRACSPHPDDDRALTMVKAEVEAVVPEVPPVPRTPASDDGRRSVRGRRAAGARDRSVRAARRAAADGAARSPTCSPTAACCSPKPAPAPARRMAYLVPAILSGQRVLVSTGTKNLQEQIYFKDLPALAEALPVKFTRRLHEGPRQLSVPAPARSGARAAWPTVCSIRSPRGRRTTETGDRAELEDLPDDSGIWSEIAATAETCLGSECPQYQQCFVTRMRQRAAESDVVDRQPPPAVRGRRGPRRARTARSSPTARTSSSTRRISSRMWRRSTSGLSVSNYRLDDLVRDSRAAAETRARVGDPDGELQRAVVARRGSRARVLRQPRDGAPACAGATARNACAIGPDWFGDIVDDGLALATALDGLEAVDGAGRRRRQPAAGREANEDAMTLARRRAGEVRDDLQFLLAAADRAFVYFLETRGRGVFLRAAPIDVSPIVQEQLFERMRATVLTSATLAVGGSFDYVRRRLGHRRTPSSCACRRSSTSRSRACSICRGACRRPKSPDFADAVARRGRRDPRRDRSGRAFVLFTSYAMMHAVYEMIDGHRCPIRCWCREPRRAARCSSSSGRRRMPCCSRPRRSGRAWTSSASS